MADIDSFDFSADVTETVVENTTESETNENQETNTRDFDAIGEEGINPSDDNSGTEDRGESLSEEMVQEEGTPEPDNKYVLKINGQEQEVTLEEYQKYAQMGLSSDQKFQEVAAEKRKFADFMQAIKANPGLLFEKLGIDPNNFAESLLTKRIEEQQLTPEQREARDQKVELTTLRKQQEEQMKVQKQEQIRQVKMQQAQELESKVSEAMKDMGLDSTVEEERVHIMADAMRSAYAWKVHQMKNQKDATVTPDKIASFVKKVQTNRENVISNYVKTLDADRLIDFLGEEGSNKVRKHFLNKVKEAPGANKDTRGYTKGTPKKKANKQGYQSLDNYKFS